MNAVHNWAARWNIPLAAIAELMETMGAGYNHPVNHSTAASEASVQSRVRLEASKKGVVLFRNNVGMLFNEGGTPVRYGLCNDTPALNKQFKSGDLIGLRPVMIMPTHVGKTIGQFVSREIKREGWAYTGSAGEQQQLNWLKLITANGGDAKFTTGEGSL